MIEKLVLGPILIATIVALYLFGAFYVPANIAGAILFVPSLLTYALLIATCLTFVHYRKKLYTHLDDGPVSYKLQSVDKTYNHPFLGILLLNILACLLVFFGVTYITRIAGTTYAETVQVDDIRPIMRYSRYHHCSGECDRYAIVYKLSKISGIRLRYTTYLKLKNRSAPELRIEGHKGIFGRTIERAIVPE